MGSKKQHLRSNSKTSLPPDKPGSGRRNLGNTERLRVGLLWYVFNGRSPNDNGCSARPSDSTVELIEQSSNASRLANILMPK
jgi:hypothetical protein